MSFKFLITYKKNNLIGGSKRPRQPQPQPQQQQRLPPHDPYSISNEQYKENLLQEFKKRRKEQEQQKQQQRQQQLNNLANAMTVENDKVDFEQQRQQQIREAQQRREQEQQEQREQQRREQEQQEQREQQRREQQRQVHEQMKTLRQNETMRELRLNGNNEIEETKPIYVDEIFKNQIELDSINNSEHVPIPKYIVNRNENNWKVRYNKIDLKRLDHYRNENNKILFNEIEKTILNDNLYHKLFDNQNKQDIINSLNNLITTRGIQRRRNNAYNQLRNLINSTNIEMMNNTEKLRFEVSVKDLLKKSLYYPNDITIRIVEKLRDTIKEFKISDYNANLYQRNLNYDSFFISGDPETLYVNENEKFLNFKILIIHDIAKFNDLF